MARRIAIALLRNDLRVWDNPVLYAARDSPGTTHLLPLFVFDERQIELSGVKGFSSPGPEARTRICGFWRTGRHRACFLAQSVFDVKRRLQSLGSDLNVYFGRAENIVPSLVRHLESKGDTVQGVWLQREVASEERAVERNLARALKDTKAQIHLDHSARTLVHESDLPFNMPSQLPDVFTAFRKRVEGLNDKMVRPVLDDPSEGKWPDFPKVDWSDGPFELSKDVDEKELVEQLLKPLIERPVPGDLDTSSVFYEYKESAFPLKGGETAARERLEYYVSGANAPAVTYKDTRNGMVGADYSTKFSPYLTFGCLSAREIVAHCDALEDRLREDNKLDAAARRNIYWIKFELLWRDYMFFVNAKYGNDIFKLQGLLGSVAPGDANARSDWTSWEDRNGKLQAWFEGRTGVPFIDACMQFFESFLLDYDPSSNYGNWAYVAGVGNDPRENRKFNVIKQAKDYDPEAEYVVRWVPEVAGPELDGFQRHVPWRRTQVGNGFILMEAMVGKAKGVEAVAGAVGGEEIEEEAVGEVGVEGEARTSHVMI
ncbi:deoxyribodipyrimidine photo-lyase [Ceratobasidium sp. AG-Ba]|nr:deoxyribodipyrimidine photo-lyase [Ceratobasidium sp. AG-Ba]